MNKAAVSVSKIFYISTVMTLDLTILAFCRLS